MPVLLLTDTKQTLSCQKIYEVQVRYCTDEKYEGTKYRILFSKIDDVWYDTYMIVTPSYHTDTNTIEKWSA